MKLVHFPEVNVVYAEDQPEYNKMPTHKWPHDPYGRVVCCWKLTWRERLCLLWTGMLWHSMLTFNNPLQPQRLSVHKSEFFKE